MYKILAIALLTTGCLTEQNKVEQHLLHVPIFPNTAEKETPGDEWDGSKGKFPAGRSNNRVIDYKGHGTDYTTSNGHINHHTHKHYHK